jgi:hypothetical protein
MAAYVESEGDLRGQSVLCRSDSGGDYQDGRSGRQVVRKAFHRCLLRAALAFPVYAEEECTLLATAPFDVACRHVIENE